MSLLLFQNPEWMTLFDFSNNSDLTEWNVVNDVVMGGRSDATFTTNGDGHGEFSGSVSLENNGGFCSVRFGMDQIDIHSFEKAVIRLKGDGKKYQFRVKSDFRERHAYIYTFETSGEWQLIEVDLVDMIPTFRGRKLSIPNFPKKQLSELRFLIGNKKQEEFKLEIDWIKLK